MPQWHWAVPVATLVLLFDNLQMMFVLTWASHLADKYAAAGDYKKVEWVARFAGIGNKVVLSLVVGVAFYLGVPVIEDVLAMIPEFITHGMDVAAGILPGSRFCHAGQNDRNKRTVSVFTGRFLTGCLSEHTCIRCCFGRSCHCSARILL